MLGDEGRMLQCYNRSCGVVFDSSENTPESCLHHPGVPVFHDAFKKWSCCDKKTTVFSEFLDIKGCTKSYHSNIKPPEPEKISEPQILPQPLNQRHAIARPDVDLPMNVMDCVIGPSLKPMLEKIQNETIVTELEDDSIIALNTPCYNNGCREVYKGEKSHEDKCMFHSGTAIFHEGMKYWSCCARRTTDFNSFLEQVGCTFGKHKWRKEKNIGNSATCRYDWHQTGSTVVISVYSKCPLPELSFVEVNPVKLHLHVTFGQEKSVFDKEFILFGVIDPEQCFITYLGTKVEICLRKAHPMSWKELIMRQNSTDRRRDCQ